MTLSFDGDTDSLLGHVGPIPKLRKRCDGEREGERERRRAIGKREEGKEKSYIHAA